MHTIIAVLFFAIAYALKGGSGNVFPWWEDVRNKNAVTERLLDGKVLSTLMVFMFGFFFLDAELTWFNDRFNVPAYISSCIPSLSLAVAWLLSVAPSMGEEHGAVGDHKDWWGPYKSSGFDRGYGVKKGLQRGAWMGLVFTLLTPYIVVGWTSLLFVPCIFIGQSLNRIILKKSGWTLAEPIIGGFCIGLGVGLS